MNGIPPTSATESGDATVINPKVTLTYKLDRNLLTYLTAANGYRSGGQNTYSAFFAGAPNSYDPESL